MFVCYGVGTALYVTPATPFATPAIMSVCGIVSFWVGMFAGSILEEFEREARKDDAFVRIRIKDQNYADGDALCMKFHRHNSNPREKCFGYVGRGEEKQIELDLDANDLKTVELFIKDTDDMCIEGLAIHVGEDLSGSGKEEMLVWLYD